ncbi:MAG: protein kinase, partial [Planctomycetes bacterium]|nr:protein kinase [Planctomycetota bacterium]
KLLREAPSPEMLARFQREAAIAARLDHPGVCTLVDAGRDGDTGQAWIAFRFVEGQTLKDGVHFGGEQEVLAFFAQAARALDFAHKNGVLHRDVKPANLLRGEDGSAVILDFGLAGMRRGDGDLGTLTEPDDIFGTPLYMAPEQLEGSAHMDARSDVYSLGAVMFEMLAGRPPFEAPTREKLFRSILHGETPDVRSFATVSKDVAVILATCLSREPDGRYESAAHLADDMERALRHEPILARPLGPVARTARWCRRNPLVATLSAGLFLTLTSGLAYVTHLLGESEDVRGKLTLANARLQQQIDLVTLAEQVQREREIQADLEEGWSYAVGATPKRAVAAFDRVLAKEPTHASAIVGRAFAGMGRLEFGDAPNLPEDSELDWVRRLLDPSAPLEEPDDSWTPLRLYVEGLRVARWWPSAAGKPSYPKAYEYFRQAALASPTPQFHFVQGMSMAASNAGNSEGVGEACSLLERHWPDRAATWEAIAQFYFTRDPERSEAAMRRQIAIEPSPAPYCGLARFALARGEREQALKHVDAALRVDPSFAYAKTLKKQISE